jgi:hypothetical protein
MKPVTKLGNDVLSSLFWADNLVKLSSVAQGLQNAIDKTFSLLTNWLARQFVSSCC